MSSVTGVEIDVGGTVVIVDMEEALALYKSLQGVFGERVIVKQIPMQSDMPTVPGWVHPILYQKGKN